VPFAHDPLNHLVGIAGDPDNLSGVVDAVGVPVAAAEAPRVDQFAVTTNERPAAQVVPRGEAGLRLSRKIPGIVDVLGPVPLAFRQCLRL
jgi:hypothetical protein